jgi:hypothetical protein
LDRGPDESLQNILQPGAFVCRLFRLGQGRQPGFIHGNDPSLENRGDQILLAAEMIVDSREIDPRPPGNVAYGNPVEPLFGE